MKKNDELIVKIEDMSENGEGIGHVALKEGGRMTLFVKDAVIGDTVKAGITKVKKTLCYARTIEVVEASPLRADPKCSVHRSCGGCQLQQLDYGAQLDFKRKKVQSCLMRIGGFKPESVYVEEVLGMSEPYHYRNKAQFPVGRDKNGKVVAGFFAGRTHSIIPCASCAIEFPGHEKILAAVLSYMDEAGETPYDEESGNGKVRHILMRKGFATGEIMVVLVINGGKIKKQELFIRKLTEAFSGEEDGQIVSIMLNFNTEKTNVILGSEFELLYGRDHITEKIGELVFRISPQSFFQVNPVQTEVLYGEALSAAGLSDGSKTVWDMYCGTGTISLFLAQKAKKVFGVEIVAGAIENAKLNAAANGIENAEFFTGAAEEIVPELYKKDPEKYRADVVVVDPPRKGCDAALLETLIKMSPERIVYISCDPATLARDLRILADGGFAVKSVQPVDMFPMTVGVENCCLLKNQKLYKE